MTSMNSLSTIANRTYLFLFYAIIFGTTLFFSTATRSVFEEDKDAIEWIEDQWARDDRPGFRENHVPSDEGAVRMRRIVYKLAAAEAREAGA